MTQQKGLFSPSVQVHSRPPGTNAPAKLTSGRLDQVKVVILKLPKQICYIHLHNACSKIDQSILSNSMAVLQLQPCPMLPTGQ